MKELSPITPAKLLCSRLAVWRIALKVSYFSRLLTLQSSSLGDVSKTWVLTGDKEADLQKRQAHRYVSAPSINLAKSLLDLLSDPRKVHLFFLFLAKKVFNETGRRDLFKHMRYIVLITLARLWR